MLEGKNVNLRIVEKEDLQLVAEWVSNPRFTGEYDPIEQESRAGLEKQYDNLRAEEKWFFIQKKDGTKIGIITHFFARDRLVGIGITSFSVRGKKAMALKLSRLWWTTCFSQKT